MEKRRIEGAKTTDGVFQASGGSDVAGYKYQSMNEGASIWGWNLDVLDSWLYCITGWTNGRVDSSLKRLL